MNTTLSLEIDGLDIPVHPDEQHEYVLETALVAKGYGVDRKTIQKHKTAHASELIEGKHWLATEGAGGGATNSSTLWTKRGIIRLGFFIRSERAKRFRDAAEDLVVRASPPPYRRYDPRAAAQSFRGLPEALEAFAAAMRANEGANEMLSAITPRQPFGAISETSGRPRTRLMPSYFSSRWPRDLRTQNYLASEVRQLELDDLLDELKDRMAARLGLQAG